MPSMSCYLGVIIERDNILIEVMNIWNIYLVVKIKEDHQPSTTLTNI